jgi:hypothetical protein
MPGNMAPQIGGLIGETKRARGGLRRQIGETRRLGVA